MGSVTYIYVNKVEFYYFFSFSIFKKVNFSWEKQRWLNPMTCFLPEPQLLAYHTGIQISPLIITDHPPQPFVVYFHPATFRKSHWICQGKETKRIRSTESAKGRIMSFPNQASFFSCHGKWRRFLGAWEGTDLPQIFINVFYAMRRGMSADRCKGKWVLACFYQ